MNEIDWVIHVVTEIRKARSFHNVPESARPLVTYTTSSPKTEEWFETHNYLIVRMAKLGSLRKVENSDII